MDIVHPCAASASTFILFLNQEYYVLFDTRASWVHEGKSGLIYLY